VPDLGIALSDIRIGLKGDGRHVDLQGQAVSGKGRVDIRGRAELAGAVPWSAQLHIEGEDFQVARRSDLEATVSPQVEVDLAPQAIAVSGRITVPRARIAVEDIPSGTVQVSPDEVIVDTQAPQATAAETRSGALRTRARLRLVLGDDVRLKAYGLDTGLTGELDLKQDPDTPAEAIGQLHLKDGRYKAYGQDLTIQQGRLVFAGPLSAAGVDVRAVRTVGDVTAGISLTGTLAKPTAQLFSTPAMDEANILSYIVRGMPLSEKKEFDRNALVQAAASFGLDKTTPITAQLAADMGLDELGVSAGDEGLQSTAMAIGKRISPDLYLRYLYGLFDNASAVQLRYSLSDHLKLEGTAGQQDSIDLIYQREKD
jgi:translocation and assembly module TamB